MCGEEGLQLVQRMFGELAVGGDLAAEDREHGRLARHVEDIVARDGGRVLGIVVIERAHAGEVVDDLVLGDRRLEIAVHGGEQIVDLALVDRHVLGAALIGNVGGADQRHVAFIGVDEDHPLVGVLEEIGLRPLPELRHDDVAALDEAHAARRVGAGNAVDDILHPRPRRIGDGPGAHLRLSCRRPR